MRAPVGAAIVAALLVAACSASTPGRAPSPTPSPSTPSTSSSSETMSNTPAPPTTTSAPTTPTSTDPPPPRVVSATHSISLNLGSGTAEVTVGNGIALAAPRGNQNHFLGVPVTINVTHGHALFDPAEFGTFPIHSRQASGGNVGTFGGVSSTANITKPACQTTPTLADVLQSRGISEGVLGNYSLPSGRQALIGCLVFAISFNDHPTEVGIWDGEPDLDDDLHLVAAWKITVPHHLTKPPPPMYTLKITGNGSYSSVITYSEDMSIEQATNASLPWSKKVSPDYEFYELSAQDGNGTSITCEIDDENGHVIDRHTSTGSYAIATCSSG